MAKITQQELDRNSLRTPIRRVINQLTQKVPVDNVSTGVTSTIGDDDGFVDVINIKGNTVKIGEGLNGKIKSLGQHSFIDGKFYGANLFNGEIISNSMYSGTVGNKVNIILNNSYNCSKNSIKVTENKRYKLYFNNSFISHPAAVYVLYFDKNDNLISTLLVKKYFITPPNTHYIRLNILNYKDYFSTKLVITEEYNEYSLYHKGSHIDIVSKSNNLFNVYESDNISVDFGCVVEKIDNESITVMSSRIEGANYVQTQPMVLTVGERYTVSCESVNTLQGDAFASIRVAYIDDEGIYKSICYCDSGNGYVNSFVAQEGKNIVSLGFYTQIGAQSTELIKKCKYNKVMVRKFNNSNEYSKFNKHHMSYLLDEPLMFSGLKYDEIYGDKLYKRCKFIHIDETVDIGITWNKFSDSTVFYRNLLSMNIAGASDYTKADNIMCDKLSVATPNDIYGGRITNSTNIWGDSSTLIIAVQNSLTNITNTDTDLIKIQKFKNWLASIGGLDYVLELKDTIVSDVSISIRGE